LSQVSDLTGISISYLNEIEKGKKYPKTEKIIKLAKAMEVSYEYLIETALRETREEIGIDTADVEILGSLTDLYITVSNFKVSPVVGISNSTPSFVPDKSEVEQIIETDINNILDVSLIKEKEIVVERNMPDFNFKHRLNAPYFDIDGHVVWGATAMILSEFSVILKQIN